MLLIIEIHNILSLFNFGDIEKIVLLILLFCNQSLFIVDKFILKTVRAIIYMNNWNQIFNKSDTQSF